MRTKRADIRVENHGSLFLLWPQSRVGLEWIREHISEDAQWWGVREGLKRGALVVEPRYVQDIVNGARSAGLEVR